MRPKNPSAVSPLQPYCRTETFSSGVQTVRYVSMMREYIFCSVIESPMIASRSPALMYGPAWIGAFFALNFSKDGSAGLASNSSARKPAQIISDQSRTNAHFDFITVSKVNTVPVGG